MPAQVPLIDLSEYPYGSENHSQSNNWLSANGIDPFIVERGPVYLSSGHLSLQMGDKSWRTVQMRAAPEEYGLRRRT